MRCHDAVSHGHAVYQRNFNYATLGGWINNAGVFWPQDVDEAGTATWLVRWTPSPSGRHIELGISEMNLFMLLGQLGLSREIFGDPLLPIGTLYDVFISRGLDALIYALYSGARFVFAGTPSGVTLSAEGGAHQSTITASIGMELPSLCFAEPAFAQALDWILCDSLGRLHDTDGESLYLRLSTRALDQAPFEAARRRVGDERLRRNVLAGAYRLVDAAASGPPAALNLLTCGSVVPEALAAAAELGAEGIGTNVIEVTSASRLYRSWSGARRHAVARASIPREDHHLARLLPVQERTLPMVTVHDAATHALSWVGSVFGAPVVAAGVDTFGQSGALEDLYRVHGLTAGAIVNAGVAAACLAEGVDDLRTDNARRDRHE